MYACENGYKFAIKCLMKNNSIVFVSTIGIFSILLFGVAIHICEK